jgi:hypothetical protein
MSKDKKETFVSGIIPIGVKDFVKANLRYSPKYKESPSMLMMNLDIPFK